MRHLLRPLGALFTLGAAALFLTVGLIRHPAEAGISGWIGVMNCSGQDVTVCFYDKTDTVVGIDASSAGISAGNYVRGGCNTSGACKVRVFKGANTNKCVDLARNGSNYIVPGTPTINVGSYWLTKVNGKITWVHADNDSKWVNRPENQNCAMTQIGGQCVDSSECKSGSCSAGLCCNSACTSPCMSCAGNWAGGIKGACSPKPYGASDPACQSGKVCDGNGACVKGGGLHPQPR